MSGEISLFGVDVSALIQERDRLLSDNTQLRKEVERLSYRNSLLESAHTACLGERDTAIGERDALRKEVDRIDKELHDQIQYKLTACKMAEEFKSELAKAHADAAVMRGALEWTHQKLDDADIPFLNTFLDSLSTNAGRDLMARYQEAMELLRDSNFIMKFVYDRKYSESTSEFSDKLHAHIKKADTLLATVKGGS